MFARNPTKYKLTYRPQQINANKITSAFTILFQKVTELSTLKDIEKNVEEKYGNEMLQNT